MAAVENAASLGERTRDKALLDAQAQSSQGEAAQRAAITAEVHSSAELLANIIHDGLLAIDIKVDSYLILDGVRRDVESGNTTAENTRKAVAGVVGGELGSRLIGNAGTALGTAAGAAILGPAGAFWGGVSGGVAGGFVGGYLGVAVGEATITEPINDLVAEARGGPTDPRGGLDDWMLRLMAGG